jgi:formylglycine-generating enzyme required for sulfatase activity
MIENCPFLVLQYIENGDLKERITRMQGGYKPMPLEKLGRWLPKIAAALDFMHSKNMIHQNLRPENILFDEAENPYLSEFGFQNAFESLPRAGEELSKNSLPYLAPEVHLGKRITAKTDQFSLAVIVYEALAGKLPFMGTTPIAVFLELMQSKAHPIQGSIENIPLNVSNALMRGMNIEQDQRFGCCAEFANAITEITDPQPIVEIEHTQSLATLIKPDALNHHESEDLKQASSKTKPDNISNDSQNKQAKDFSTDIEKTVASQTSWFQSTVALVFLSLIFLLSLYFFLFGFSFNDSNQKQSEVQSTAINVKLIYDSIEKDLVLIQSGKFLMGSPITEPGRNEDEIQHEVTITKPFYLGKFEVSQEQWENIMGSFPDPTINKGSNLPVSGLSWNDCQDFIKKLNENTMGGYRLPTEAEWEYACRAGAKTAYSFGETLTNKEANFFDTGAKPLGSYNPNAFGLYDMHGNVWEWCNDWKGKYSANAETDPQGPLSGTEHILRGGSFITLLPSVRSSNRFTLYSETYKNHYYGFRLAKTF